MPWNLTNGNDIYLTYMYKEDLALNNLQWLICLKTQPNLEITTRIFVPFSTYLAVI